MIVRIGVIKLINEEINGLVYCKPKKPHQIAEKIHRRSLIFFFTDMFQTSTDETKLFEALRHLKHNKHEVVLFHVFDKEKELRILKSKFIKV